VLAAEVQFVNPPHRSVQVAPGKAQGNYLITFYERQQPVRELQKLPFRRTQLAAMRNGHKQSIYLKPSGQLDFLPQGGVLQLVLSVEKLPSFAMSPEIGEISMSDLEVGLELADRLWKSENTQRED